jgi:preprotein translocase SecF subunit
VFDIIGRRRWYYLFSLAVTIPGLIFILLTFLPGSTLGLRFSIAYTGGTVWEIHFRDGNPDPAAVTAILDDHGLAGSEALVTSAAGKEYILIRTSALSLLEPIEPSASPGPSASPVPTMSPGPSPAASPSPSASPGPSPAASPSPSASPAPSPSASPGASAGVVPTPHASPGPRIPSEGPLGEVAAELQQRFGPIDEVRQETSVGPVVSAELIQQTFLLILMGTAGIMLWITFRFGDFRMGATAIGALIHDVIVVVGIFAILGTFFGLQVDALFVTAMLTVIGFSVHDTIVVFDRIRENKLRHAGEPFEAIVNHSILQTIGRSINTSLTVIITLTALLLFGGEAIHGFVLALLIGITSGTYSSIFNASPLLLDWHLFDERRRARQLAGQATAA